MNRVLLYVHFNKNGQLSEHVVYQLRNMRPLFSNVVFITNSKLLLIDRDRLRGLYDNFIQRENVGFDFAAWRDGINNIGWDQLAKFDSLTIMNDTCFGPIYPIIGVYRNMEDTAADFWGITDHPATKVGMPGTNGPVPQHIQSYLEVFNDKVIKSETFRDFWNNVKNYKDVTKLIQEYETKLTGVLTNAGFKFNVYFDTEEYSRNNKIVDTYNYSELLPVVILRNGVPLLKIKSFLHTSQRLIIDIINKTDYPPDLITDYLEEMHIVNTNTVGSRIKKGIARRVPGLSIIRKKFAKKT